MEPSIPNMPSGEWWKDFDQKFTLLRELLEPKSYIHNASENVDDEQALDENIAPPKARHPAFPSITILPSETTALRLTARDEQLELVAFGTVRNDLFLQMIWESISCYPQGDNNAAVVIHEVDEFQVLRVVIRVGSKIFELKYFHCPDLVRRFPNITDSDASFLSVCGKDVQGAVQRLQKLQKCSEKLEKYPEFRTAYYYARAWAVVRGLFSVQLSYLTPQDTIRLCGLESSSDLGEEDGRFSRIVYKFFRQHRSCSLVKKTLGPRINSNLDGICESELALNGWSENFYHTLHRELQIADSTIENISSSLRDEDKRFDWHEWFVEQERQPFFKKMDFPTYIRVSLTYSGSSMIQGGKWLSMVERKVCRLNQLLESCLESYIRLWPHLVVAGGATPEDFPYEGSWIIGLSHEADKSMHIAKDVTESWKLKIIQDELTSSDCCYIDIVVCTAEDIMKEAFKSCNKRWTRPTLKLDEKMDRISRRMEESGISKTQIPESVSKVGKSIASSDGAAKNQSSTPLRPALDVLNRLRYDPQYSIDDYVIGYLDRHTGLEEKAAAEWEKETTQEEWIPQHRILFFKKIGKDGGESELVWVRSTRLDRIFGSGVPSS